MCLLAFSWNVHPRYPLIFAGNRDEFHARPAAAADWWPERAPGAPAVFGGRDLEAGGSWLGVRRDGRFAVVTNFREPDRRPADKRSRGELVTRFLVGTMSSVEYLQTLRANADDYAGFNLVFGDIPQRTSLDGDQENRLYWFSNRTDEVVPLAPGVHALSNRLLDTPWPKVRRLRERFAAEVARREPRIVALLDMLADTEPATADTLPDTGIAPEWEHLLSAAKIVSPTYGTRASTVVLIDNAGNIAFHERRFAPDGQIDGDTRATFDLRNASGTMSE